MRTSTILMKQAAKLKTYQPKPKPKPKRKTKNARKQN